MIKKLIYLIVSLNKRTLNYKDTITIKVGISLELSDHIT